MPGGCSSHVECGAKEVNRISQDTQNVQVMLCCNFRLLLHQIGPDPQMFAFEEKVLRDFSFIFSL